MCNETSDKALLNAITGFIAAHPDPAVARFKAGVANWGVEWRGVTPSHLAAADYLTPTRPARQNTNRPIQALLTLFADNKHRLLWEQSYKKADRQVSEAMLAGYGFAEVIGKNGPFISERVRCGIGVWGPHIIYPQHHHQAEEIYIVLAGSALFTLGAAAEQRHCAGDVVFVSSHLPHQFCTEDDALVVLYLWQAGNLREKSTFSSS